MHKKFYGCLTSGALMLTAATAMADEAKDAQSQPSRDSALFDRLDANQDGQLAASEVPAEKQRLFQRLLRAADRDGNGSLSRAEFLEAVANRVPERPLEEKPALDPANPSGLPNPEKFFENFDKNKDGKITLDEVPDAARERLQQLLARADKNNDSAISLEEMKETVQAANAALKAGAGQGRDPRQTFNYLDTNGDGKVELDEVPGERREGFERLLKMFDKDGDGKLNEAEYVAAMQAVQARQGLGKGIQPATKPADAKPADAKSTDAKPAQIKPDETKPVDGTGAKPDATKPESSAREKRRAAQLAGKKLDPDTMLERAMRLDKNKDGKISREEAAGPIAARFDKFDANGDGFVEESELRARLDAVKTRLDAAKAAGKIPDKSSN